MAAAGTTVVEVGRVERDRSPWREASRRLQRNRAAIVGLAVIGLLLVIGLLAPVVAPYSYYDTSLGNRIQPPSAAHWLGTDDLGRDVLSRIVYGARISLLIGVLSVGISLAIGLPLGAVAGYAGGLVDSVIMRVMDVMLAFPSFLLAVMIAGILGPSLANAMIAIGVVQVPRYVRILRASVLSVKAEPFVEAASALGAPSGRILVRHVVPNCLAPLIVQSTLGVASAILEAAGLSFLGLGAQPPSPEWGAMLASGRNLLQVAPWVVTYPGIAILVAVLGFNLFGDGLRDALDPRLKT
ncbi:MAG TPA: nickel transporter permease [Thermodesulfobacteriota bacterium]